jgi:probable rRNA maturation factor
MSAAASRREVRRQSGRGPTVTLTLQNPSRSRCAPPAALLRRWARAALATPAAVTVRVVGAAESQHLNRSYRGRNHATNVLSFDYGRGGRNGRAGPLRGDIVLCAPVVWREARRQGKPVAAHYAHLLVHGLLHLQGHDHGQDRAAQRMERRERRILAQLGFADPYRDRQVPAP